jgi:outer membrane protein TolC
MLRRWFLIPLLLAAGACLPGRAEPLNLSLDQALARGLASSLTLQQVEAQKQVTEAGVGISRSQFLPKLDLVGLGTWAQVGSSIGFISNLSTIGDLNIDLRGDGDAVIRNSFGNLGLALTYTVLDFERAPLLAGGKPLNLAS